MQPATVYLARLAPTGRRSQAACLDRIAEKLTRGRCDSRTLPWERLSYQYTAALRTWLMGLGLAPSTVNGHLAALRGTLKTAWRLGLMSAEDFNRAVDLEPARGDRLPTGRGLSAEELRALFRACAEEPQAAAAARNAAMLAVLYAAGTRRGELVTLDLADYDRAAGSLRIRGKGNKERLGYATDGAAQALDGWLMHRGDAPGPLFCPVNKAGRVTIRRLTGQAVFDRLQHIARAAGVADVSPHDARRSFISDVLDATGDLAVAQQLAGHANPATTARYDRRGERAKRRAAELLQVPYVAPGG